MPPGVSVSRCPNLFCSGPIRSLNRRKLHRPVVGRAPSDIFQNVGADMTRAEAVFAPTAVLSDQADPAAPQYNSAYPGVRHQVPAGRRCAMLDVFGNAMERQELTREGY